MSGFKIKESLAEKKVGGGFTQMDNDDYFKIENYDRMEPFFMTLVSSSDHWFFISSTGGLTIGRKNSDHALFPYYVEDRIAENYENTGSKTVILVEKEGSKLLWEPFTDYCQGLYHITRNIYKNTACNKIIFEEQNHDLGLCYQYCWMTSARFGFVKKSTLINMGNTSITAMVLDGIQNILPSGTTSLIQNEFSCLMDAYKKNELDEKNRLAFYRLSSVLTDKAEPLESLCATVVWCTGIETDHILLTSRQIGQFRNGYSVTDEKDTRGRRGAYFIEKRLTLSAGKSEEWLIVAELDQDHGRIAALQNLIQNEKALPQLIMGDIAQCTERLKHIAGLADGFQTTGDRNASVHHYANTLFNLMRGGLFEDNYQIEMKDFLDFIQKRNRFVFESTRSFFREYPAEINYFELERRVNALHDNNLIRLFYEYLPLSFSRRHGDPSRPWNSFLIELFRENGEKIKNYQGNWRDIFQNWEALGLSYPGYIKAFIAKFLNAVTMDGYNPYRLTRDSIDWESPNPDHPWANIGYWGDHQIIYFLKLAESLEKYEPGSLINLASTDIYSYADVPYRIKPYSGILKNNRDTIVFDFEADKAAQKRYQDIGGDGKLCRNLTQGIVMVNLAEKVLLLFLAKLSNYVPGGGIWMNTQRPEWNDANNALTGPGLSVVTLCYLRRFSAFFYDWIKKSGLNHFSLSGEIAAYFYAIRDILKTVPAEANTNEKQRKTVMDRLGNAADTYRSGIYQNGLSGKKETVSSSDIQELFREALRLLDNDIRSNRRNDGLYHSYNLLRIPHDELAHVDHLYEMLEGQVAVLSSGCLNSEEAISLLTALRNSHLYREDQKSYILYPDRELPEYIQLNAIPEKLLQGLKSVGEFVKRSDRRVIYRDDKGVFRFNSALMNGGYLERALTELEKETTYEAIVREEKAALLQAYEAVFHHQAFTGRSCTFFAYEGLGSIYWHMVSKLLLAVQENYFTALDNNEGSVITEKLSDFYYSIREGLGFNKSPESYGAFPTDPYSHTPSGSGARQPGMTGQVKEEILTRMGELGLIVRNGVIYIKPSLLRPLEFLAEKSLFQFVNTTGAMESIELQPGQLGFTCCQVPVIYEKTENKTGMTVFFQGKSEFRESMELTREESLSIFQRKGIIKQIWINLRAVL